MGRTTQLSSSSSSKLSIKTWENKGQRMFEELSEEEKETIEKNYGPLSTVKDLVRTIPRSVTLSRSFISNMERLRKFPIRSSDVWVVTPPKCGTMWLKEMTWLIMNGADIDRMDVPLLQRSPFLDFPMIANMPQELVDKTFDDLEKRPSPRLINTHLPFELLPPDLLTVCKVIFCCRNVKDAAVSFYHHQKLVKSNNLVSDDFESYARDLFKPALIILGGYFEMLESGWKRRDDKNVLFLWYEDMKKDQKKVIREIMKHVGSNLTDAEVDKIDENMKFENYKKTSSLNKENPARFFEGKGKFVRKGIVGDHVNYFTAELSTEWDEWISTKLNDIGIVDENVRLLFSIGTM